MMLQQSVAVELLKTTHAEAVYGAFERYDFFYLSIRMCHLRW